MPLPNFFLIGAQKCGTDALYHALRGHPEIFMSPEKEPSFFITDGQPPSFRMPNPGYARRVIHDWDRYRALFDAGAGSRAIGEASAIYLSSYFPERTAARIRARFPEARLIALVRQPADRAYSSFRFYRARELEPINDFSAALAAEAGRIAAGECPDIRHRLNGMYHANLKPYFQTFPKEQIRVYLHDDWVARPRWVLEDIFRFLGVDTRIEVPVERVNVTTDYRSQRLRRVLTNPGPIARRILPLVPRTVRNRMDRWNRVPVEGLDPKTRSRLTLEFGDDITKLGQMIGRDLSHWLENPNPGRLSA